MRGRARRCSCTSPSSSRSRCASATRCCSRPVTRPPTRSASSTRPSSARCATPSTACWRATRPTRRWSSTATGAWSPPTRAPDLLTAGAAPHLLEPPVNVLRLSLHPEGVAPRIANLPEWRAHLLDRLGREAVAGGDPALAALHEELAGYPGGGPGGRARPRGGRDRRPAADPPRRRRARVHQHGHDVRHGRRRHGQRAVDRVVLPRRRGDRGRGARARPLAFRGACTTSTS